MAACPCCAPAGYRSPIIAGRTGLGKRLRSGLKQSIERDAAIDRVRVDKAGGSQQPRLVPSQAFAASSDSSWPWCDSTPGNGAASHFVSGGVSSARTIRFPAHEARKRFAYFAFAAGHPTKEFSF